MKPQRMETLIEHYLLRHKYCPLPALGVLEMKAHGAVFPIGENKCNAPYPQIIFSNKSISSESFVHFIANKKGISNELANQMLISYCNDIVHLNAIQEKKINHTGKFYVDVDGSLSFKQYILPEEFFPSVKAERVIHPNSVHQIQVGDRQHSSDFMSGYLKSIKKINESKWWPWALASFVVAAAMILCYVFFGRFNAAFGNGAPIKKITAPTTYQSIQP
jgi:hypothetical protein